MWANMHKLVQTRSQRRVLVLSCALLAVVLAGVFAPLLVPRDPGTQKTDVRLEGPGLVFEEGTVAILGTDQLGRDVLSRAIFGIRASLFVGISGVLLAGLLGVGLGLIAGYFGGPWDMAIMRLADIQLAFPGILMALALTAALGPSVRNLIVALTVTGWVLYARLVRGVVLSVKEREFVEGARALGASNSRIVLRHVLPNVISPVVIVAALDLGRMILAESSLSFLGLGIQPPTPSWGSMIADGRSYLFNAWWVSTFPGLFLAVTVMVIALLGDAVRDSLDPHFRY